MPRSWSRRRERLLDGIHDVATSFYAETPPPADVADVVACLWLRVARDVENARPIPIIPDGCGDLMVYDDHPPIVAGPDAITRWVTLGQGTVIVGARFRPGGFRAVFGCAATTILNRTARLSDVASGATRLHARLHEQMRTSTSVRERQSVLIDWIRTAVWRRPLLDAQVRAACRWLTRDTRLDIGTLAHRFGWNARTLRREFHAACGYGPKHFQRIMRVQRAIRASHAPAHVSLSDIALAAGYADQAHMTRDFRDITGFTPAQQLATTRPEFGLWIAEGW